MTTLERVKHEISTAENMGNRIKRTKSLRLQFLAGIPVVWLLTQTRWWELEALPEAAYTDYYQWHDPIFRHREHPCRFSHGVLQTPAEFGKFPGVLLCWHLTFYPEPLREIPALIQTSSMRSFFPCPEPPGAPAPGQQVLCFSSTMALTPSVTSNV